MTERTPGEVLDRRDQLFDISTMVAGNFELQEVLDRLAEAAVKVTNTTACSIRLLDDEAADLKMRSTYGLSEEYRNKGPVSKDDPVISAAFEGEAVIIDDMRCDSRVKYPEAAAKEGLISQLTVAMKFRDKPIGVLRLYSPEPARFDEETHNIARIVASQCAVAITNARLYREALEGARMAEQMRLAAEIQRRMIPSEAPCCSGLDVAAIYEPCFQIGGDLYDFVRLDEQIIAVAIADVIGKGVPAAMMMSMFRGALRAYSDGGYGRHSMIEIITKLNTMACRECRDGEFITLFLAIVNVRDRLITYCNCGHEPGLLLRGGDVLELNKGGLVLGIMDDAEYATETVPLALGDCLLMYTDGLIDAMNFDNERWGKERMVAAAMQCAGCPADEMVRTIIGLRRRFVGLAPQIDDTSVVAVKLDGSADDPNCECKKRKRAAR
ncbi:MAG TPA: SpoIIE family protein phosphatase [Anaerohalosphaeraceae bacterium]|nr:SpoIIE family protein phosphatase [Anaerohalosphaeraceae bacterium]HRT49495.1 SpoIIE family protein phosphatase [Anaerohalosphaeraceae bacterium]HRT85343.1 SpoIIE family protein phosphatase [Anaerohalosphaeraceae bacterium]